MKVGVFSVEKDSEKFEWTSTKSGPSNSKSNRAKPSFLKFVVKLLKVSSLALFIS